MSGFRFSAVNLGCSKNLVDLEFAIGQILKFSATHEVEFYESPEDPEVEYVLINTCGFLSSAREESEETLARYDALGKKLILMGCYVSVKDDAFLASLKNLSTVLPFVSYENIESLVTKGSVESAVNVSAIERAKKGLSLAKEKKLSEYLSKIGGSQITKKAFVWKGDEIRAYINAPFGHEYLKIAEGCDNNCTFCIIPKIRGRQKSRPMEDVITEVRQMVVQGISEIQIIAQDTVRYGTDIYDGESKILDLLEAMEAMPEDFKFRVYYLYPDNLTLGGLERLSRLKKMIPWFDIPFQHSSPAILKKMGRCYDRAHIEALLDGIQKLFPGAMIRTSFIIGFPGETDADFENLLHFVEKYRFASVGVFQYHDEALAASSQLPDKVPDTIAKQRLARISEVLNGIYDARFEERKGKKQRGWVMSLSKKSVIVRPELHAPEVDEYDDVDRKNICTKTSSVEIGQYIEYIL